MLSRSTMGALGPRSVLLCTHLTYRNCFASTRCQFLNSKAKKDEHDENEDRTSNDVLANALNLLSPSQKSKHEREYKPSILDTLMGVEAGSNPSSQYQAILPQFDTEKHLNTLLTGIFVAAGPQIENNYKILSGDQKDIEKYLKSMNVESHLVAFTKILKSQNKLTPKLLTTILLNRHLNNLDSLPFDVTQLEAEFVNWSRINHIEMSIILLKKYYDLRKPTFLIQNLKKNMKEYINLIDKQELKPFYGRIVWRLYFEYITPLKLDISKSEQDIISKLNNVRISFMILESSTLNFVKVADLILQHHKDLNVLQKCYLEICCSKAIRKIIERELEDSNGRISRLQTKLKKISIKFKVCTLSGDADKITVNERLTQYSIISAINNIISEELLSDEVLIESIFLKDLSRILKELKEYKNSNFMYRGVDSSKPRVENDKWDRLSLDLND